MSLSHPPATADLAATAAAFGLWRDTKPSGARIPEALWSQATKLARTHGVARVATTLRLDYVRLKRRLTAQSRASTTALADNAAMLSTLPAPRPAPDFTLPGIDGNEHRLAASHGRYLLVNFRAVWCQPCR